MTTTDLRSRDVPIPAGVDRADQWQNDVPLPYRVLFGELRGIDGLGIDRVSVQPTAIQFIDGRIDDGGVHEPPNVYLGDEASQVRSPASWPRWSSRQPTRLIGG